MERKKADNSSNIYSLQEYLELAIASKPVSAPAWEDFESDE